VAGAALLALGLGIRAWAAGVIHKDRVLSTTGPYAHTRNPLYFGTFFVGLGAAVAGGQLLYLALFLVLFVWVYGRTMRDEARRLEDMFGDDYRAYAEAVPLFLPRATPARLAEPQSTGFDYNRWKANREYEALAGAIVVFGMLVLKLLL